MLTATIRVQTGVKPDVRAVVVGDDALRIVPKELGPQRSCLGIRFAPILQFVMQSFEAVCRINSRAASSGYVLAKFAFHTHLNIWRASIEERGMFEGEGVAGVTGVQEKTGGLQSVRGRERGRLADLTSRRAGYEETIFALTRGDDCGGCGRRSFPRPDNHDSGKLAVSVQIAVQRHVDNHPSSVL
jgi:hypothetical protein